MQNRNHYETIGQKLKALNVGDSFFEAGDDAGVKLRQSSGHFYQKGHKFQTRQVVVNNIKLGAFIKRIA